MEKPDQELDARSPHVTQPDTPTVNSVEGVGRPGRRRSAYATRDLTTGSIPRNLLFIA